MKKLVAILLCVLMCFTAFAGCKGNTDKNLDAEGNVVTDASKILDISVWDSGYGTNWIKALANQYKSNHSGIAININAKYDQNDFGTTIDSNADANATDIYFNYAPDYLKYTNKLEDLTALANSKAADSETKTIAQKFGEATMSALTSDGKVYALCYGSGATGIVYNAKFFDDYNAGVSDPDLKLNVPRTTKELKDLIILIKDETEYKGTGTGALAKYPLLHYPGYWQSAAIVWWLQYSGAEEFNKFFQFTGIKGNDNNVTVLDDSLQSVYQQVGMKKALEELYAITSPTGNTQPDSNDTSEGAFSKKQSNFIEQGIALMYPCGGWLETEMEKATGFDISLFNNFKMMRYPVLSALVEKLSDSTVGDTGLSELVEYVDKVSAGDTSAVKPDWATDDDVTLVTNARFAATGQTASSTVCIPNYSKAKDLAKDFLKFVYSDAGLKLFAETQRNFMSIDFDDSNVPNTIDKSNWTEFSKSVYEISGNRITVPQNLNHPIRYRGGLKEVFSTQPEKSFTADQNAINATEFLNEEWKEFKKNWESKFYQYVSNN